MKKVRDAGLFSFCMTRPGLYWQSHLCDVTPSGLAGRAGTGQLLLFHGLSFQGVNVSMRQVSHLSGGQWPRRDFSLTAGSIGRGAK